MEDAKDKIDTALQTPGYWLAVGDRLLSCADVLWTHIAPVFISQAEWDRAQRDQHGEPYITVTHERIKATYLAVQYLNGFLLLTGCAVENYLKAAIICRVLAETPDTAPVITMPRLVVSSHDQLALARKGGILLSEGERDLLRRLTRAVVWSGRYPVPKKPEPGIGIGEFGLRDRDLIYEIRERVYHLVYPDRPVRTARPLPSVLEGLEITYSGTPPPGYPGTGTQGE